MPTGRCGAPLRGTGLRVGRPAEAGLSEARVARAAECAHRAVETGVHDAVVAVVARRGIVVLEEAYRRGDALGADDLTTTTTFPLASLTKPITAAALMVLVDDGTVGLSRPVAEYVPELRGPGTHEVCLHHLLTHTSGLEDPLDECERVAAAEPAGPGSLESTQDPFVDRYLRSSYDLPLRRRPGEAMTYCNFNYELIGEVVRRVSGMAFDDFCRARIFEPLGMRHTCVGPNAEARWSSVRPLRDDGLSYEDEFLVRPSASGGAWSTASDMAMFVQMHLDAAAGSAHEILSSHIVREMTRNQIPGVRASCVTDHHVEGSWGLGWVVSSAERCGVDGTAFRSNISHKVRYPTLVRRSFSHLGSGGVFVWGDPEHDLVGSFFATTDQAGPGEPRPWAIDLFVNAVNAAIC